MDDNRSVYGMLVSDDCLDGRRIWMVIGYESRSASLASFGA